MTRFLARLVLMLAVLAGACAPVAAQVSLGSPASIRTVTTLPATCGIGQVVFLTTGTTGIYECYAVNTWRSAHTTGAGTGDASTNASSSVDSEIALFSGTGGKTLKRAALTGVVIGTSGVASAASAQDCAGTPGFLRAMSASYVKTCAQVANADLAGSIAASKLVGTDIATVGTLGAGATGAGFTVALGTSTVTGILGSANGGTANGFTKFSGPTSSEKTFTLPNASATVLTDNALVTGAQGGTSNGFFAVSGPASSLKTFTFPNASATVLTTNAAVTVAQGGSGAATLTGVLKGNGTSAFTAASAGTDFVSPTGSETLTNKTLTSPIVNTPVTSQSSETKTTSATISKRYTYCDATSGNVALTLPSAASFSGREVTVLKIDSSANTCTVTGTVSGDTNHIITSQWNGEEEHSNGTSWYSVSFVTPALTSPGSDKLLYRNDTTGNVAFVTIGANLTFTSGTLTATNGGGDASTNTSSSVDSELALFSSTTGKLFKRASGTGLVLATSGVASYLTTSAGVFGAISDESGSGALLGGTAPTIAGGTHTAITSFGLRSTGAAFDLKQAITEAITADKTITWTVGNTNRAISLGGDINTGGAFTTAAAFATSGLNSLTLTTTGSTNVTLPTSGTLATIGGSTFTGGTIPLAPIYLFTAAVCQNTTASIGTSTPTSNAPAAACKTGSNTTFGVAQYTATTQNQQGLIIAPYDLANTTVLVKGTYMGETTSAGNVVWTFSWARVADGSTMDPAWNDQDITDAAGTANQKNSFAASVTMTSLAAGDVIFWKLTYKTAPTTPGNQDLISLSLVPVRNFNIGG